MTAMISEVRIRKGDLVMLDPNDPEISRILDWDPDRGSESRSYMASRPTTSDEQEEWREHKQLAIKEAKENGDDTFHIAFDDAGESRLAPRSVSVPLPIDEVYIVQRARCRVSLGWGRPYGGMTRILSTKSGEHAYVKRTMLKPVQD